MKIKRYIALALSIVIIASTFTGCGRIVNVVKEKIEDVISNNVSNSSEDGVILVHTVIDLDDTSATTVSYDGENPLPLKFENIIPGDTYTHQFMITNNTDEAVVWSIRLVSSSASDIFDHINVSYTNIGGAIHIMQSTSDENSYIIKNEFSENLAKEIGTVYDLLTDSPDLICGTLEAGASTPIMVSFSFESYLTKEELVTLSDIDLGAELHY